MSQNFWVLRNYAKNDHSCCHCHSHILWQLVLGLYLMTADQYPSWLNGLITNDAIFLGSQKFCGKIMICLMMTKYKRLSSKCRRNSWVSEILRKNYNLLWRVSGDSKGFHKMTQNFLGWHSVTPRVAPAPNPQRSVATSCTLGPGRCWATPCYRPGCQTCAHQRARARTHSGTRWGR